MPPSGVLFALTMEGTDTFIVLRFAAYTMRLSTTLLLQCCVLVTLLLTTTCTAHESCCKHKLQQLQQQEEEFLVDPNDNEPPKEWQGQRRLIPDPDDVRPDHWDDEDDGIWEPIERLNVNYHWEPRKIRNPNYQPPASYWDKLFVEVNAAIPWVTLGVVITGVLSTVLSLPLDTLQTYLSRKDNSLALLVAALLGLATPLCSCGALPLVAGLVAHHGVPLSSALAFLTATQSAGLDSAAITWGLLGPTAVFCRLGGALFLAMVAGMACGNNSSQKQNKNSISLTSCSATTKEEAHTTKEDSQQSTDGSVLKLLKAMSETAVEILPTVLAGLALSTAVLHYLAPLTNSYSEGTSFFVRIGLLLAAMPLQLCEHTTVTLAAAIQKAGGSPGLAFSFLLSAPATNMPSLLLLMQQPHGVYIVVRVMLALGSAALALSYLVDAAGVDLLADKDIGNMAELPPFFVTASPWFAGGLFVVGCARTLRNRNTGGGCRGHPDDDCCSKEAKPKTE
jgi:uncharacterized membrane protein YraQ (UPF0718 family)